MKRNFLLLFSISTFISAQEYKSPKFEDIIWEKSIGGENEEYLFDAIATPDYGFLLIGSSNSNATGNIQKNNNGSFDFLILKMDENGNQEWQNSFGGNGEDYLKTVTQTPEGGFILVGSSNSSLSGDKTEENLGMQDIWIIKLNPLGQIEWQKTIGGLGNDEPISVISTSDNGYLIGAISDSPNSIYKQNKSFGSNDIWIIKLDANGNISWEKTIGAEQEENLKSIIETTNGYLIGGISNSKKSELKSQDSHYLSSVWLVNLNKEGEIIDEKTIKNDQQSNLISLKSYENKIILVFNHPAENELNIIELDENLSFLNTKSKKFKSSVKINSVLLLDNNYLISANNTNYKYKSSLNQNDLESKYLSFYLNNNLEETWKKEIGKNGSFNYLEKAIPMRNGSILLVGNSNNSSNTNGQDDFYLVKLGNKSDEEKRIYIEAYPNPTDNFVNVLINKEFEKATIEVYNLTGQHLKTQEVKYHTTPISLGDNPSGIYILKINTDNQTESIRVIKK